MHTFHVVVPAPEAELAADRLWQLGVEAVGIDVRSDGSVELTTAVGDHAVTIDRAVAALEPSWRWELRDVEQAVETWRDHVAPTWYDDSGVVVPAWRPDDLDLADEDGNGDRAPQVLVTMIEPAASFGLGDHPTTATTLAMLAAHLRRRPTRTVLDVGCGSGVLGIVAAQLGARVRAVDISAAAIEATVANADRNGVAERVIADTSTLDTLDGPFDVVVANILAPALIALAADLRRLVAPDGSLFVSGVLAGGHDHVLRALEPLRPIETRTSGGWAAVELRRSA